MDVPADLAELTRTPMAVVSAEMKSILDIGLTLERLEATEARRPESCKGRPS